MLPLERGHNVVRKFVTSAAPEKEECSRVAVNRMMMGGGGGGTNIYFVMKSNPPIRFFHSSFGLFLRFALR